MAIAVGIRLGPYEIVSRLGAGGMGEVYRARDSRLHREVAIKVLPAAFSADSDRLRRFEQEGRAAGSLNHPNILTIYDIGSHDGSPYVVSELLEGETLRERIGAGPLSQRRAADCALQMAHGLAAAHAKGIVHRDLKPENIFVTQDGRVKILDFGLAKLFSPLHVNDLGTEAPTVGKIDTDPGTVMGTAGYMSPEQVRGRPVDHRSDIFSFGAILYEMLTGRRAFQGESGVETMNAILKEDPPELTQSNRNVNPALERVVDHCLEKKPEERFQSASDLAFALEALSGLSAASDTAAGPAHGSAARTARAKEQVSPALLIAAIAATLLVAIVIAAGAFFVGKRVGSESAAMTGAAPPSYRKLTFQRGTVWNARFAPDGQTIVYSASWNGDAIDVYSTRAGNVESRSLNLRDADLLAISSQNEMLVLRNRHYLSWLISRGTLARMPLDGSAPRDITEDVQEADWSPDGSKIAVVRWVDGRNRLEYPMGNVLYETTGYISHPRVSPQDDLVAFQDHQLQGDNRGWLAVVDLNGNKRTLTSEYTQMEGLAWSADGSEIWYTASQAGENEALYVTLLSGGERLVTRSPTRLLLHDISRDGRMLLSQYKQTADIIGLLQAGGNERNLSWFDDSYLRHISADGKIILFDYSGEGGGFNYAAYIRKTDGSPAIRLGDGTAQDLSPDGRWALAVQLTPSQVVLLPTGAGEARPLPRGPIEQYAGPAKWLPDGKHIAFVGKEPGRNWRIYIQDISGGNPDTITPDGTYTSLYISPDGKLFCASDFQSSYSLHRIEGGEARPVTGIDKGMRVIGWGADSRSLFAAQLDAQTIKVYRVDLSSGRKDLFKEITSSDPAGIMGRYVQITPDGKAHAYQMWRHVSELYLASGLR